MSRSPFLLVLLLAAAAVPGRGAAQARTAGSPDAGTPRLAFLGGFGYEHGGPGPSLVDGLVALGYDDPTLSTQYDDGAFYRDAGIGLVVRLGVRANMDRPVSLELWVSNGPRGHAGGYDSAERRRLALAYTAWFLTGTVGLELGPVVLKAGPMLSATRWTATINSMDRRSRFTWTGGGTLALAAGTRIRGATVSLEAGIRELLATPLDRAVAVELEPRYGTFFVALSASPGPG